MDDLGTNLGCFLLGNESSSFIYCFYQKISLGVTYSIIHPAPPQLGVGHPLTLKMADYKMLPFQPHRQDGRTTLSRTLHRVACPNSVFSVHVLGS